MRQMVTLQEGRRGPTDPRGGRWQAGGWGLPVPICSAHSDARRAVPSCPADLTAPVRTWGARGDHEWWWREGGGTPAVRTLLS